MIQGFEDYTEPLTPYEKDTLIPILCAGLKRRIGVRNIISNKQICTALISRGYPKINEARIRKCINYIRLNDLVPFLLANSKGYYVATSYNEVEDYILGVRGRANSINAMGDALERQLMIQRTAALTL